MSGSNNKNRILVKLRLDLMKRHWGVYFGTDHDDQRNGEVPKITSNNHM